MLVPVDIPCSAHTHPRICPLIDIFLCQSFSVAYETMAFVILLLVGIVHVLFEEIVAQRAIRLRQLRVTHERLRG